MNLTPENYYSNEANRHYMSVSQYKDFLKCEAAALAKLNGEYEESKQDCFLLGSYVHAAIESVEANVKFREEHPEIFCSTGKNKGELKSEYRSADVMIDTILSDDLCATMLQGEKELIVTAELFGVLWKAKIDVCSPDDGRITDLKTVKSIREKYYNPTLGRYESFIEHFGYTTQLAVYSELERLHSKRFERLEPFIVAVSKEDVPDKEIICFDDATLETELQKVRERLPRVQSVKLGYVEPERCEKCKYCRKTKKAQIVHYSNLLEVV